MTIIAKRALCFHHPERAATTTGPLSTQGHSQRGTFRVAASPRGQLVPDWVQETQTFMLAQKTGDVVVLSQGNLVDGVEHPSHVWPHGREVR